MHILQNNKHRTRFQHGSSHQARLVVVVVRLRVLLELARRLVAIGSIVGIVVVVFVFSEFVVDAVVTTIAICIIRIRIIFFIVIFFVVIVFVLVIVIIISIVRPGT